MRNFSSEELLFVDKWGVMPVDRTGLLSHCLFNNDLEHPIPEVKDKVSLEECINSRCKELSTKDNLALMWSGGIDSTLVFYALIDNNIPFQCIGDWESVIEYPELADQIKRNQFTNVEWVDRDEINRFTFYKSKTLVTGEIGDQIIGTDKLIGCYKDISKRLSPAETEFDIKQYSEYYKAIHTVLDNDNLTVAEFSWAMNFLFKFTYVKTRMVRHLNLDNHKNLEHMFTSDMFQQWALQNYSNNVHFNNIEDYKMPYKEYIYSHNGDDHYRDNKIKIGSLKR